MTLAQTLFADWVTREPIASLLLAVVVVLLFGVEVSRSRAQAGWVWGRRLIEAFVKALAFVSLLGAFYFLLTSGYSAFQKIYSSFTTEGSLSNQAWQHWRGRYGENIIQDDLRITQYIETETRLAIQPTDPSQPPLYKNVKVEQHVSQNSILGFRGQVTINLVDPAHERDTFNAYTLSAVYEYRIINPAETETRVEFNFPLSAAANLYEDVSVKMNGAEVPNWRADFGSIVWEGRLSPGEQSTVSIHYVTRGMDSAVFQVPTPREVKDFEYTVTLDTESWGTLTEPENGGVQLEVKTQRPYQIITWKIDQAILAPRLGVFRTQSWPYAPYQEMIVTLPYAARALLLCLSMLTLTLLICNEPVRLRPIALLACLFAIPFLLLMAGGLPAPKAIPPAHFADYQVKLLPVLAVLPLSLAFITLRKLPRLPLILSLSLMAFFLAGYPFIGLLTDEQKRNAVEEIMYVGLIAYTFGLVLYIHLRKSSESVNSSIADGVGKGHLQQ